MQELIEQATKLGKMIAEHERTTLLRQAQQAVDSDPSAETLVTEYKAQAEKIQKLEANQQPVEVEDKHKLRELDEKISENKNLIALTRRQADYIQMMNTINETLSTQMG